jgi:creatinine amidohydrolase
MANSSAKPATIKSVLLWENQRRYVREALDAGTLKGAMVPTGSTEQHNEHLAMIHDAASALHVSRLAAERLYPQAVVTTPLAIGVSEHWMAHKGTLTLRPEVFAEVLYDVCDSLRRHGIKNVLVVNGHAGNVGPVRQRLDGFRERLGINLAFHSYWEAYTPELIAAQMESGQCPAHAAEFETSFALAAFPGNVDWDGVDYDGAKLPVLQQDQAERDREYHHQARLASAQKGKRMIEVAVDWIAGIMRQMISGS